MIARLFEKFIMNHTIIISIIISIKHVGWCINTHKYLTGNFLSGLAMPPSPRTIDNLTETQIKS